MTAGKETAREDCGQWIKTRKIDPRTIKNFFMSRQRSGKLSSDSGQSSATAKLGFIAPVHFTLPWLCEN